MLNGAHDASFFPDKTSQAPLFEQFGTPAANKKHVKYSVAHFLPQEDIVRETLGWFDRYLSDRTPPRNTAAGRP
jgi:hypothetical protein